MKSPKILLIGIGGVYNYGCEAIVRGTEVIIRREYPDADILYASSRVADDVKRLEASDVQVIDRRRPRRFSGKNILRKVLSLAGIRWDPMMEDLCLLKDVDAVFSIGGDIYTLNPNADYSMSFPKFVDAALNRKIPCILWGASVGPFTENPEAEKFFIKHLNALTLITARESLTVEYLRLLGVCKNVVACADPAYLVAPEIKCNGKSKNENFTIGINLSPLSVSYTDCSIKEFICTQAKVIEGIIKSFDARIIMIPHVVCDFNEGDDDFRYLDELKQAIAPEHQGSLKLLKTDAGFIGIKKELIKCDLVIAARMHCAINALTAHVPTILIAYTRKAEGMCQYVYGNKKWMVQLSELGKENILEDKVRDMKKENSEIRDYLAKRIPEIQNDSYLPIKSLRKVLASKLCFSQSPKI